MARYSLKNQKQFDLVNKHGLKIISSCFIIIIYSAFSSKLGLDSTKLYHGLKVSKKFAPNAVDRNLAKRRIRSIISTLPSNFPNTLGSAIVVIPKRGFNKLCFKNILQELNKIIKNHTKS